jgi:transposase
MSRGRIKGGLKLDKSDVSPITTLLKSGNSLSNIANIYHVSSPTLRSFMIKYDLYKYANSKSAKIALSNSKRSSNKSTYSFADVSNLNELIRSHNDLNNENPKVLENLLKSGMEIPKIAQYYNVDNKTIKNKLDETGLYNKYYENGKLKTRNNPEPKLLIPSIIKEDKKEIKTEENKTEDMEKQMVDKLDFLKNNNSVNDVVLKYINDNLDTIIINSKMEELSNSIVDRIINIFSDDELQNKNTIQSIKQSIIKSIDDLLL